MAAAVAPRSPASRRPSVSRAGAKLGGCRAQPLPPTPGLIEPLRSAMIPSSFAQFGRAHIVQTPLPGVAAVTPICGAMGIIRG